MSINIATSLPSMCTSRGVVVTPCVIVVIGICLRSRFFLFDAISHCMPILSGVETVSGGYLSASSFAICSPAPSAPLGRIICSLSL